MPKFDCVVSTPVVRSGRVLQLEGIFEIPPTQKSELHWKGEIPTEERDWSVGLIVGPSGSGKSTLARQMFSDKLVTGFEWSADKSIVDDFPASMSIREITTILNQVGFSSPPAWLRPFRALSNGEQFRVTLARAMAESSDLFVIDEFTSVVDRTVAQIGSVAVAKTIRKSGRQMIAVGCHYDIIDWLQPDWVYEPHINKFQWRELHRHPDIELEIVRCDKEAWNIFRHHHYLDTSIGTGAKCFVGLYQGRPVVFSGVTHWPHPSAPRWRGQRLVTLPDYQGVGIGMAFNDYIASLFKATDKPYTSVTAHPAIVAYYAKSKNWNMRSVPKLQPKIGRTSTIKGMTSADNRLTASFDYIGPARAEDARRFGVI